jgi:4-hydroxybenzoate polyprenyltransferase
MVSDLTPEESKALRAGAKPANKARQLARLMRPHQWVKNGFVLVGALFSRAWHTPLTIRAALLAMLAFCLTSSAVYVFNDWHDMAQDREHPKKRARPLAAGTVSVPVALGFLVVLLASGLAVGWLASPVVFGLLLAYILINIGYSQGLKHVVILDVFLIASGFMLRLLAGTVGVGIAPSQWLLLCGMMMALFLGFSKRRAELYALNGNGGTHRQVLEQYSPVLLDNMIVITAACVVLMYSLYTTSPATVQLQRTEGLIYTVPFVIYGIFRYLYSLHAKKGGGDPAQELIRDPHVLLAVAGWLATVLYLIS